MAQQDINGTAAGEFSLDDSKKQGTRLIEKSPLSFLKVIFDFANRFD